MSGCAAPEPEGGEDEMTRPQVRLNIRPNQPGSDNLPNYRQLKKILSQLDCKKPMWWIINGFIADVKNYKILQLKLIFLIKNCMTLISGPLPTTSKLQEKPLVLKKENTLHLKLNRTFLRLFLFLWVIFAYLDPDLVD